MKYTLKNLSDTKVALTITLTKSELAEAKKVALGKLAGTVKVAGFRKGKVPASVAEKHLVPGTLDSEVLERGVNKAVVEALEAENIQPLDRPSVEVTKYEPGDVLEFTAEVEILPEIKLGDYKSLKVTPEKISVSAKDIDEVIERMRASFSLKSDVVRAAKSGDEVVIDFEGKDEKGELVPGASGKDYPLTLGSDTFIPGFEAGIIGKKLDEAFELPLTFPKDYHAAELAGAHVTFTVTIKKIQEVTLPAVDDELAKKAGPFENAAELKDDIKRELTAQKERTRDDKVKDELVGQLVGVSTVPVPEVLVADQQKSIERDTIQNLLYRGMTLEQYLAGQKLTKEEWQEKELKAAAIRRVQVGLALAELSKVEKIEATKAELDARHEELLQQYPDPTMRAQLDTPESRRDLANRILTEKTIERLRELNVT
jgi:trigger factor